MIQKLRLQLNPNSSHGHPKPLGTPKWPKFGAPVNPKIWAPDQKNLVQHNISLEATSMQSMARIADIGLIFTLITHGTAPFGSIFFFFCCRKGEVFLRFEGRSQ